MPFCLPVRRADAPLSKLARCLGALTLLVAAHVAQAQIIVGQTSGFTGPVQGSVKELTAGAQLWIDAVNARGGVYGQRIDLVKLDDRFDPKQAAENARQLIQQGAIALMLARGTPHTQAILPLLKEHRIALVAPSTGAMLLHNPVNPYVFNVRATYQRESERIIVHLDTVGTQRIAVLHVDDTFGADAVAGADRAFQALRKQPVLRVAFDRDKPDFAPIVPKLIAADAQAVLFVGTAAAVAEGTRALRAAGSKAQIITLSNNASTGFVKTMGEHARGVIVSQVFPNERSAATPLVNEALELARARKDIVITPAALEGFAAAKVLVEGLRRAGPQPTRAKLLAALDTLSFSVGGMELGYSPKDHSGLHYVELSIISEDGRFTR